METMQRENKSAVIFAGVLSALALNQSIALPVHKSVKIKVYDRPKSIDTMCWEETGNQIRQAIYQYDKKQSS